MIMMQGFPKHIATKQDFENLLNDKEFKEEALIKLQELQDFDDRTATKAVKQETPDDPMSDWITEEIENPSPIHRQYGFKEWMDLVKLNAEVQGVKVSELTDEYSKNEIEEAIVVLT
jgi:hypothetical protein